MIVVVGRPGAADMLADRPVEVNGVIGEEGAFMILPPQLLQVDPPDGLWLMPDPELRLFPSRPARFGW